MFIRRLFTFKCNYKLINQQFTNNQYRRQQQQLRNLNTSITKIVHQYSNIKIKDVNYNIVIKPFDVHDCPDSNQLRATLISNSTNESLNINEDLEITIKDKQICITTPENRNDCIPQSGGDLNNKDDHITCLLEIPIKSDVECHSNFNIDIENMYSDYLKLSTINGGQIKTKNIHGTTIDLCSESGDIQCLGLTLAHKIDLRVKNDSNLHLDKVQGDLMFAICDSGTISTNSCYVEASKFVTLNGCLHLKNIHKFTEAYLLDGGQLFMTGFHGKLQVKTNGGNLFFQLTELYGDGLIEARDPLQMTINISEFVEDNTFIDVNTNDGSIQLQENLLHLNSNLIDNNKRFQYKSKSIDGLKNGPGEEEDQLCVSVIGSGDCTLGKMSWMDTIKLKIEP